MRTPCSRPRASPATAWRDSLRSRSWAVMACSRSTGSSMPTGSSANMADTLLVRVLSPAAGRCRRRGADRHGDQGPDDPAFHVLAPAEQQVPEAPGDQREDHVVDRAAVGRPDALDVGQVGVGPGVAPVGPDRPVEAGGRGGPDEAGQSEHLGDLRTRRACAGGGGRASRAPGTARRGWWRGRPRRRGQPGGRRRRPGLPVVLQRAGTSGDRSRMTDSSSVPDTPSTRQWWTLDTMAQRPSSRPSTIQISHSGLVRSSCWDMTRPTSRRSPASPPGAGRAVWRTWYSMLKCGSSAHTGRPSDSGTVATCWR